MYSRNEFEALEVNMSKKSRIVPAADQLDCTRPASLIALATSCIKCVDQELKARHPDAPAELIKSIESGASLLLEMPSGGSDCADKCTAALARLKRAVATLNDTGNDALVKAEASAAVIEKGMQIQN